MSCKVNSLFLEPPFLEIDEGGFCLSFYFHQKGYEGAFNIAEESEIDQGGDFCFPLKWQL